MPPTPGNRITLLKNGAEFFPALINAIDCAKRDIRIETYIFLDDETGQRIAAALQRAAQRGVAVHVLVDGLGSRETARTFFDNLRSSGARALFFRPERGWLKFSKAELRRIHRKIALFDGEVGFIGGINLLDDMTDSLSATHPRYDYSVKIEGPVLADMYDAVHQLWRVVAYLQLPRRQKTSPPPSVSRGAVGEMTALFVQRDNVRHRRAIEHAYLAAIGTAREKVLIVSPYFLPGRKLRASLAAAAQRGVKVTLLLQGLADHPLLRLATHALYSGLMTAGVIIHEYERAMLHAKVATIDDQWATVGSSNLDPFSLFLNREANLIVLDATFATQLRQSIETEMADGAVERKNTDWQQRSRWQRFTTWFAYRLARAVSGWVGFKGERRE